MLFIILHALFFGCFVCICIFMPSHSCCTSLVCILKQFYAQQFFVLDDVPYSSILYCAPFSSFLFIPLCVTLHLSPLIFFFGSFLMLFLSKFGSLIKYRNKIECAVVLFMSIVAAINGHYAHRSPRIDSLCLKMNKHLCFRHSLSHTYSFSFSHSCLPPPKKVCTKHFRFSAI